MIALDPPGLLAPVGAAIARPPIFCTPEVPIAKVLDAMHEARIGCMPVVDRAGIPVGIFTTVDVLECVAPPLVPMDTAIGHLMTRNPVTLPESATLTEAALAMTRHGIRHVLVTSDGRLTGVLSQHDLFFLQRLSGERITEQIRAAEGLADLIDAADAIRRFARHLIAQDMGAGQVAGVASALNDALAERVVAEAARRFDLPAPWCWAALGSQGRREQVFPGDQDNALLVAADGADPNALKSYLAFAQRVNADLAACGFPLCDAGIVASDPRWCRTLEDWRALASRWIGNPVSEALLNINTLLDARAIAGNAHLLAVLRDELLARISADRAFCRALAQGALRVRPRPEIMSDRRDLKSSGSRLFVEAARVLAAAAGRSETSTAARLRALGQAGALPAAEAAGAVDAFHYIQGLRLKEGPNTALDRRMLKEALEEAALLQERIRLEYGL